MVVKDTFFFETVTDGYKEANFMGISKYIYKTGLTSDKMYLPMSLAKKKRDSFVIIQRRFPES